MLRCSFGGHIIPRPTDGHLRYAGGNTRIVSLRRDATLPDLTRKMAALLGRPAVIRYQLPDVDIDALVSVSSSEDLENMMEEYDKLAEAKPDGSAKLRLFLFPAADPVLNLNLDNTSQCYFDAVNGISTGASSNQNSDVCQISTGSATDGIKEVGFTDAPSLPVNSPSVSSTDAPVLPANTSTRYVSQAYVDPNQVQYINPQSFGVCTGALSINGVTASPHPYNPLGIHLSMNPMVSQVGSVKPVQVKEDSYLEEKLCGGSAAQLHDDRNCKAAYQPLLQLPPLLAYLQPQSIEGYGLQPVVQPPSQQGVRMEDCCMGQNGLAHTQLDNQENWSGPESAASEATALCQGLHSEEAIWMRVSTGLINNGPLTQSIVEPKIESMNPEVGFTDAPGLPAHSPAVGFTDAPSLPVNSLSVGSTDAPELPANTSTPYVSQTYVDPNQVQYINPQSLGVSTGALSINGVTASPHPYNPLGIHLSMNLMVSQVGSVKPVQVKEDSYLEEKLSSGSAAQLHGDRNYEAVYQPLSQLPPLLVYLQPQSNEGYGLQPVVQPPSQQGVRMEYCCMGQKGLAHTQLDIQENWSGPESAASEATALCHDLHSEEPIWMQVSTGLINNGSLTQSIVEPKIESMNPEGQFLPYGFAPIPEIRHAHMKLVFSNGENSDHGKVLRPPAVMDLPGDTQEQVMFSNILQAHHDDSLKQQHQKLPQSLGQPQILLKPNLITKPTGNDVHLVRNVNGQATEHLSLGSVFEPSNGYGRSIDGMMEAICVSPSKSSEYNEKWKPIVTTCNPGTVKDLRPKNPSFVEISHPVRSLVGGNTRSVGNVFINPGNVSDRNYVRQADQLLPSPLTFTDLQSLQPPVSSHLTTSGAFIINQETGDKSMVSSSGLHVTPAYSTVIDSAQNNAINNISIGLWKDESSQYLKDMTNDLGGTPNGNDSFPLPNSDGTNGNAELYHESVPSNHFFCNQDPRKILDNTNLLLPQLPRVASKESAISMNLSDNLMLSNKGPDAAVILEEDAFHQLPYSLNKDSCLDPAIRSTRGSGDEQIKQDLQVLAERVTASVLQSSVTSVTIFAARETKEPAPQSNKELGLMEDSANSHCAAALGDHRIEDIRTKQVDKVNLGFPVRDETGRLQIIKNSDLEDLRELGSGTFGTVYHGKWRGSDVAIKRINDRCFAGKPSEQERLRADFWNEVCKLADLHHPNVVAFYGVVLDGPGGSVATVTEYMTNGSLRHVLQRNDKTLDNHKRLLIAMDVAFGMEYLHGKNIVHFDLKSDNLLVNLRDPHRLICKVGDLGLSKVKCKTLISGGVRGTLPWMAPELLNGSSNLVSEKVDVFSFGIVMWELLTGEEPYANLHYGSIIGGIVSNTLRPPVPESCGPEWRSLMEDCWSAEPSKRPSFTEIASRLRAMDASLSQKGR